MGRGTLSVTLTKDCRLSVVESTVVGTLLGPKSEDVIEGSGKIIYWKTSRFVLTTQYHGHQIKESEIGWTSSTYGY